MNVKSTVIIAAALVVSILGAGFLISDGLSRMQLPANANVPAATLPADSGQPGASPVKPDQDTLTVSSGGAVSVKPDRSNMSISLSLSGGTAKEVNERLTASLAELIADFKAAGVAEADLQTSGININSDSYYKSSESESFSGYTNVTVTVRDLDKMANLVDIAAAKEGYSSCYFDFGVEDRTQAYNQALEMAVEDAHVRAETLSRSMGRTLGAVIEIIEGSDYGYVSPLRSASSADSSAAGIIEAGSVEVSAYLKVTYLLGPAE